MNTFKSLGYTLVLAGVIILTAGCPSSKNGKLVGWVTDESNTPLPFVLVKSGDQETHTDGSGLFSIDSVDPGSTTVTFALNGYADTSQTVDVKARKVETLNVAMKQLSGAKQYADPSTQGSFSSKGASLTIPGGSLDSEATKSGTVNVHLTALDVTDEDDISSLPGGLIVAAGMLNIDALVNISVEVNGSSVSLNAGATCTLRMPVPAGSDLEEGDQVALWYFDVHSGAWVQDGTGTVIESSGHLYIQGTITHLGWWCCAVVETGLFTVSGHVYDASNQPVENALVVAHGIDYHGATWAISDEDGAYSLKVLPDRDARIDLVLPGAYYVCDHIEITAGAAGGSLENQDLSPDFKSCIQGHVTEEDGTTPIEGTTVYSSAGGSAVTDEDGAFCMLAPGSTNVAVYVLGRPPMFVKTPATATCDAGNGADVTLSVEYPKNGDRLGFVFGSLRTVPLLNNTYLSTSALFYSGFKGDQFAPYDPDAPLNTYTVHTAEPGSLNLSLTMGQLDLAFNVNFGVNESFNLEDGEVPSITKIGALDAGSPAGVTNGTDSFELLRPLDFFYPFLGNGSLSDLGYAMLEPWMGGFYFQEGLWSDDFAAGDTLTFTWPGGVDMGQFSGQITLPGNLNITAPTSLTNAFSSDALANGLAVTWDTQGQGTYVTLVLESIVYEGLFNNLTVGAVVCKAADDGSFTIPAEALAQLPHLATKSLTSTQINYLFAKRHTVTEADVPLTRNNGNGYVVCIADSAPVLKWSLDWHVGN